MWKISYNTAVKITTEKEESGNLLEPLLNMSKGGSEKKKILGIFYTHKPFSTFGITVACPLLDWFTTLPPDWDFYIISLMADAFLQFFFLFKFFFCFRIATSLIVKLNNNSTHHQGRKNGQKKISHGNRLKCFTYECEKPLSAVYSSVCLFILCLYICLFLLLFILNVGTVIHDRKTDDSFEPILNVQFILFNETCVNDWQAG